MQCLNPITLKNPNYKGYPDYYYLQVPCGKCTACLSNKRRQWAFRLNQECKVATSAYFITLTYNDDNCPEYVNKKHCQDFLKRLRKLLAPSRIRYFLVSEYGDDFGRPHYHLLLFNYPHSSEQLRKDLKRTWTMCDKKAFDIGDVVAPISPAAINYCCKYCLATCTSDNPRDRTFMLCSRRPAIGSNFLTPAMVEYLRQGKDGVVIDDGYPLLIPRYYDDKVFDTEYLKAEKVRVRQQHAALRQQVVDDLCNKDSAEFKRLQDRKFEFDRRVKSKLKNGKNQR